MIVMLSVLMGSAAETARRDFQISLVSPLGTNGILSNLTTNNVSLNIIGGYSYANEIFELGGVYNVNIDHVSGVQLSGIVNYSRSSLRALQLAGITNIVRSGDITLQIAGITNISDRVRGLQLSGIVNVAKCVSGVQIGLINYCDTCHGVPIGLFNIVRRGGKQEFELAVSDALNVSGSFKLGVDKLYTIFSGGVNFLNDKTEYGLGLGFGTQIGWKNGWGNQIEILGYSITEGGNFQRGVNMLSQLKINVSKKLRKHLKVFAGPVLNMTVSDYVNPDTGITGCSICPYSLFDHKTDEIAINGWIGFNAGVSF